MCSWKKKKEKKSLILRMGPAIFNLLKKKKKTGINELA